MTPQEANEAYYSQLRAAIPPEEIQRIQFAYGQRVVRPDQAIRLGVQDAEPVAKAAKSATPHVFTRLQKFMAAVDALLGINQAPQETNHGK